MGYNLHLLFYRQLQFHNAEVKGSGHYLRVRGGVGGNPKITRTQISPPPPVFAHYIFAPSKTVHSNSAPPQGGPIHMYVFDGIMIFNGHYSYVLNMT